MDNIKEKERLSSKMWSWIDSHFKLIPLILFIFYLIIAITITVITMKLNGGWQAYQQMINEYPEQQYQQLEQELQNIIEENDGIYAERLSKDDIKYEISYRESNSVEGIYEIELTDSVKISAKIGKDFSKKNLQIDRQYKTAREYKKTQICFTIVGIILESIITTITIVLVILVFELLWLIVFKFILSKRKKAK